jgi:PIN domain nuclease of toxin-antitoxin system
VRLLLDTQAFLLWIDQLRGLPGPATRAVSAPGSECYVSHLSAMEIAMKSAAGKLRLSQPIGELYPDQLARNGFRELAIRFAHIARFGSLSARHADPFDRLLAAQALEENLMVVSGDRAFDAYGVKRIW